VGEGVADQGEGAMNAEELRARQAPIKQRYRDDPGSARATLRAVGRVDFERVACRVETPGGGQDAAAGLHSMAGGDGSGVCSGDMLLQALVGCAGVTLAAVAMALGIEVRGGVVEAEGDLDFRGTLGVARVVPVGFGAIRLTARLETTAEPEALRKLGELTERYCVVYQTLRGSASLSAAVERVGPGI
jgi:uncharacterized OsmC-like protein